MMQDSPINFAQRRRELEERLEIGKAKIAQDLHALKVATSPEVLLRSVLTGKNLLANPFADAGADAIQQQNTPDDSGKAKVMALGKQLMPILATATATYLVKRFGNHPTLHKVLSWIKIFNAVRQMGQR